MNEQQSADSRTLGQRIQEGRKAAGLSQETLGEKLEVSRQAVSKWESDAAVPELEKLIAMSRLFGMTVGTLLGVEPKSEEQSESSDKSATDGELTEKELAALEIIASRYADALENTAQNQWTRKRKWGVKLFALGLCFLLAGMGLQLGTINSRLNNLNNVVDSLQNNVFGQIGSITGQVSGILEEQNDLLADSSAEIVDFDPTAKTVSLNVSALPKELLEGATGVFTAALSDGRKLTAEAENDGGHFAVSNWIVPMDDAIQITVVFTSDGTAHSAVLNTLCAAEDAFEFRAYGGWGSSWMGGRDTVSLSSLDLTIETGDDLYDSALEKPLAPVKVDVCLFRNLEAKPEKTFSVKDAVSLWDSAGRIDMSAMTGYETSIQLESGDTVIAAVRIRDNYGRTVCFLLDAWERPETGEITTPLLPTKTYSDGSQLPGLWTPGTALA